VASNSAVSARLHQSYSALQLSHRDQPSQGVPFGFLPRWTLWILCSTPSLYCDFSFNGKLSCSICDRDGEVLQRCVKRKAVRGDHNHLRSRANVIDFRRSRSRCCARVHTMSTADGLCSASTVQSSEAHRALREHEREGPPGRLPHRHPRGPLCRRRRAGLEFVSRTAPKGRAAAQAVEAIWTCAATSLCPAWASNRPGPRQRHPTTLGGCRWLIWRWDSEMSHPVSKACTELRPTERACALDNSTCRSDEGG